MLYPYAVTRVDKDLPDEVEALLAPVHDLDISRVGANSQPVPIPVRDVLPEWEIPIRRGILEGYTPLCLEDIGCCS